MTGVAERDAVAMTTHGPEATLGVETLSQRPTAASVTSVAPLPTSLIQFHVVRVNGSQMKSLITCDYVTGNLHEHMLPLVSKMSSIPLFRTPEEITAELERQQQEDDEFEESCSEDEDGLLMNDDDVDDEFDAEGPRHDTQMEIDPENREFLIGKDGETIWTNKTLQSPFGRTPARNIITHFPGAKGIAKDLKKEIDLFSLFVTEEMMNILERYTNEEIERKCSKHEWLAKERYTHPTNVPEIKALIGLLFMAGELKNSGLNLQDLFSPIHGPPIFRYGMSKNRFQFLLLTLRFDDKNSRAERKANDRFAAFREFWELFLKNCRAYYTPSEYVTVDETLLSFRGRCIFRMYMKNKPDKYGLKIVSLCDAKTYYFLGGIPYLGKERREIENVSKPTSYVLNLVDSLKNSNRNVTTDNWFTSCELADKLTSKKLTLVGTMRKNKREIPPEFLETKGAPVMSSRFLYDPEKMMVSFTPKKNKNVILLSSMHGDGFVNEVTKKPEIIEFYNMTKGELMYLIVYAMKKNY
ncbi:piggyBac transposable element-derived protein 4-like [Nilaparvata lugens]|uniref:piggyBac transposable element-derived protein 4-like n=1 Tax=Nilaparvata lugens TaxID=108931 RepID=UPI00193D4ABE|nr:piggyBac transposable element-derived protein 4-like [Nilaparvata lugens]